MLYFRDDWVKKSTHLNSQWNALCGQRQFFNNQQKELIRIGGGALTANQAALIPQDAYRDLDEMTMRVFREPGSADILMDLMPTAKTIGIQKTVSLYRVSSDTAEDVTRSVNGQVPASMDKVIYNYFGDPVIMFMAGYGREWREWAVQSSENFDALSDDAEAKNYHIKRNMEKYLLFGDSSISVKGYTGQGLTNHTATQALDLGAAGSNIDLTTDTSDNIIAYFTGDFALALDNNFVDAVDVLWVSPQLMRRLEEPYSAAAGFKEGTLKDYLIRYGRIRDIRRTFELGRTAADAPNGTGLGNEFLAYVRNPQSLRLLQGMAVGTFAVPRFLPTDNYNFLLMGAMGVQVKQDNNGRSKVFYASELT